MVDPEQRLGQRSGFFNICGVPACLIRNLRLLPAERVRSACLWRTQSLPAPHSSHRPAIYVLIIGFSAARLRTLVVSNISDIWLQQSACPDHLWQLAVGIWVARNAGRFSLESSLYQQLIELLRSPDALIAIGKEAKKKVE